MFASDLVFNIVDCIEICFQFESFPMAACLFIVYQSSRGYLMFLTFHELL